MRFKAKPIRKELHPIMATYPFSLVHMDYLSIENPKSERDVNVLVIIDNFTCYAQAFVISLQTAKNSSSFAEPFHSSLWHDKDSDL